VKGIRTVDQPAEPEEHHLERRRYGKYEGGSSCRIYGDE
jgi:hypothetical protein